MHGEEVHRNKNNHSDIFQDIHTNPIVETENKQAKCGGDFVNQVLEMLYLLKPSQVNLPVGTVFQRSSVQLDLSWVIFRFTWCLLCGSYRIWLNINNNLTLVFVKTFRDIKN
jgi:hypothetical protein